MPTPGAIRAGATYVEIAGDDRPLTEAMRTPEERARGGIGEVKALLAAGAITQETYNRAVHKAVEDAAAAMPDAARHSIGVRGTFSAAEARGLGAGNVQDRIAAASEASAKCNKQIVRLMERFEIVFN